MAYKFLDAKAQYSDPATSGLKVLDAGTPSWAAPDMGRKALDATAHWSVPEIAKPGLDTPANLIALAKAARTNPTGMYEQFKGQTTPAISFGSHGSVQFELCGCMQDNLVSGGKAALSLFANAMLNDGTQFATSNDKAGNEDDYSFATAADAAQSYLTDAFSKMDDTWKAVVAKIVKDCGTAVTKKTEKWNAYLWVPSFYEVGITNTCEGFPVDAYSNDGEVYMMFTDRIDIGSSKRAAGGGSFDNWLTRTVLSNGGTPLCCGVDAPADQNIDNDKDSVNADGNNYFAASGSGANGWGIRLGFCVA